MTSTTTPTLEGDALELVQRLEGTLASDERELAELEPKREQLTQRIESVRHTLAVLKGETPEPPKRKARRPRKPRASA
jgi:hypothetical protein